MAAGAPPLHGLTAALEYDETFGISTLSSSSPRVTDAERAIATAVESLNV